MLSRPIITTLVTLAFGLLLLQQSATSQSMDVARSELTSQVVADRLLQLAEFLRGKETGADQLKATVQSLPRSRSQLSGLKGPLSGFGIDIDAMQTDIGGTPPNSIQATVLKQQKTISQLNERASSYADYAPHLEQLSAAIRDKPIDEAVASLNAAFLPKDVASIILRPTDGGAPVPVAPHQPDVPGLGDLIAGIGTETTIDYPSVGELVVDLNNVGQGIGGRASVCTVTLISPRAVLTAAHCFCDLSGWAQAAFATTADACRKATYGRGLEQIAALDKRFYSIYFQHAGSHRIADIRISDRFAFPAADIAVAILDEPVAGITPTALNEKKAIGAGQFGYIVGFGEHSRLNIEGRGVVAGRVAYSQGLKLYGTVKTTDCSGIYSNKGLLCWSNVASEVQILAGTTCHGDSGGPLFISQIDGTWVIAGVTSGIGNGRDCAGGLSYDVDVFSNIGDIRKMGQVAPSTSTISNTMVPCMSATSSVHTMAQTPFPFYDRTHVAYKRSYYSYPKGGTEFSDKFLVTKGFLLLRVSVNGTRPSGNAGLRLEITAPGETLPGHVIEAQAPDLSCSISAPTPGNWAFTVRAAIPQEIQVVSTVE